MKTGFCLFIFAFLTCFFYSCGGNNPLPKASILGNWNLQQQHIVKYINGVKRIDTVYTGSVTNYSHLQFNSNNTYISNAFFSSGSGLGLIVSADTIRGTYTYSSTLFSISNSIAGFNNVVVIGTTGPPPVITLVTYTPQIMQLTSCILTLHIDYTYTASTNTVSETDRMVQDYYYTK